MRVEIEFQEEETRSQKQLTDFLLFLENQKSHNLFIRIELTEKERLALEFYAYQMEVKIEDIIEESIRSRFDRFFEFL